MPLRSSVSAVSREPLSARSRYSARTLLSIAPCSSIKNDTLTCTQNKLPHSRHVPSPLVNLICSTGYNTTLGKLFLQTVSKTIFGDQKVEEEKPTELEWYLKYGERGPGLLKWTSAAAGYRLPCREAEVSSILM